MIWGILTFLILATEPDSEKVYQLSPFVGYTIDAKENEYYELFELDGFEEAQILQTGEEFFLLLKYKGKSPELRKVELTYVDSLSQKIAEKGEMPEEVRKLVKDPNKTRLFIMPTGQTLKKGKSYFANYELFFIWYSSGLTDELMLSLGMTILPSPNPTYQLYYLGPKVRLFESKDGQSFSLGAHLFTVPAAWSDDFNAFWGAVYGAYTIDKETYMLTIGAGTTTLPGFDAQGAFLGYRAGIGRVKFLAEYWHLMWRDDEEGFTQIPNLIIGMRFAGQNMSADLGIFYPNVIEWVTEVLYIGIPVVNFVYNF